MKAFCIVLVSLLLFAACQQQQVKAPDIVQKHAPLVIDYPAGVIITQNNHIIKPETGNIVVARKILSQHLIPLLDTTASQMVFVKQNGDRVTLNLDDLSRKYDIVLFDAVRNPLPLKMDDLQNAVNLIFNKQNNENRKRPLIESSGKVATRYQESELPVVQNSAFSKLRSHDKRIIVSVPDSDSAKLAPRTFPGILWIEHRVDTRTLLKITFENDLITYANTDRYFTNGITFSLQAPWLEHSPFRKLMIPYRKPAFVTYNLSMFQDMYTPTDTRVEPKLHNDRPYASYLYFGFRKTNADPLRKLKISSRFDLGYIGPYSPGSYLQTIVHKTFPTNDVPQGWETQINTDLILNYNFRIQKGLVNTNNFSLLVNLDLKAGTLYNNAGAGFELQAGKSEPIFGLALNEHWPKTEYYFFAKTNASFVAYNALLQGGMIDHNNVFTLQGNEIQRLVGSAEAGFHVRYKGAGIELAQHYLSPEYKGGYWHKWGRITLIFNL